MTDVVDLAKVRQINQLIAEADTALSRLADLMGRYSRPDDCVDAETKAALVEVKAKCRAITDLVEAERARRAASVIADRPRSIRTARR